MKEMTNLLALNVNLKICLLKRITGMLIITEKDRIHKLCVRVPVPQEETYKKEKEILQRLS